MKVLLADDHPLFVDGLRNLLTSHGFEVLGTARNGLEALEMARTLRPELILMDIQMPQLDGLAAMCLIQAEMPEIKVLLLTMSAEDENLFEAIRSGACGYLLKTQDTDEFFSSLEDVARGEVVLSRGLVTRVLHEFGRQPSAGEAGGPSLSKREVQVLTLVAQGLTYKEVAARLFVSERTIKYHMGEIIARLQMNNRDQVIEYARRSGLVGWKGASALQRRLGKE